MSKLDDILNSLDYGYTWQMSDYATSKEQEAKMEADGLAEIAAAKQEIKDLMLELIDQTVPKSKPNAFNIPTLLDKIRTDLAEKVNEL